MLTGGLIADGDRLEKVVKRLVAEIGKVNPQAAAMVKFDAQTYNGVRFHVVKAPIEKEDQIAALGEQIELVLGLSDSRFYFAAGRDAAKLLKDAIDKSKYAKDVPPFQMVLAGEPLAKFTAEVPKDNPLAGKAAETLKKSGKDCLTLTASPVPNGMKVRLEIQEGLLKLLVNFNQMQKPATPPQINSGVN